MQTTIYTASTEDLKDENLFNCLYYSVPEYRRHKIDHLRFEKDKCLSLGVGLLFKRALEDLNIKEEQAEIGFSKFNKPFLKYYPNIHFNLSHAEERVMCSISEHEIGCDVEWMTDISDAIAKQVFAKDEYDYYCQQKSENDKKNTFFRLWTLKESFMKATGLGFELPPNTFSIDISGVDYILTQKVNSTFYRFAELQLDKNYRHACCIQGNDDIFQHIQCNFL